MSKEQWLYQNISKVKRHVNYAGLVITVDVKKENIVLVIVQTYTYQ